MVGRAVNEGDGSGRPVSPRRRPPTAAASCSCSPTPLEVIALAAETDRCRSSQEQLAKVLSSHSDMAGVIVDSAGPSIVVERDALTPVLALAVALGD